MRELFCAGSRILCVEPHSAAPAIRRERGRWVRFPGEQPLEQKAGEEPHKEIIQADEAADVETAAAVVPGTAPAPGKAAAAGVLRRKNGEGIEAAPDRDREGAEQLEQGLKEGRTPIDGEHPGGGDAFQLGIFPAPSIQAGPGDFQAPSGGAAADEVF